MFRSRIRTWDQALIALTLTSLRDAQRRDVGYRVRWMLAQVCFRLLVLLGLTLTALPVVWLLRTVWQH